MQVQQTAVFRKWFEALRDDRAKGRITSRIVRLREGNAGDARSLGGGLAELKIDYGPGYRVYYVRKGDRLILLLCGGDKSSQKEDIQRARVVLDSQLEQNMAPNLTAFDPSEYLATEEAIRAFLEDAMESGDPKVIAASIGEVARAKGMSQLARQAGMSRESLYRALSEDGNPQLGTVVKVLKALGIQLSVASAGTGKKPDAA